MLKPVRRKYKACHHSIFAGQTLFLVLNQQCQSTESKKAKNKKWIPNSKKPAVVV